MGELKFSPVLKSKVRGSTWPRLIVGNFGIFEWYHADDILNCLQVYAAMAESLGEAWKDLNAQLEYRKMLLDQSIAFHESANMVRSSTSTSVKGFRVLGCDLFLS